MEISIHQFLLKDRIPIFPSHWSPLSFIFKLDTIRKKSKNINNNASYINDLEWTAVPFDLKPKEVLDLRRQHVEGRPRGEARHQHFGEEDAEGPELQ